MKVKPISGIDTALRIFYQYTEIGNKEIRELFGGLGSSTLAHYKKAVREKQAEEGIVTSQLNTVDTDTAYQVWGIDVKKLEERRAKLKKLGFA